MTRMMRGIKIYAFLAISPRIAQDIANRLGEWPLFHDAKEGLRRLMQVAPCIAMTNSDLVHREQIQEQLGFRLSAWVCAEEVKCYKPSSQFWHAAASRTRSPFSKNWWHVSAYADYDLDTARKLGLTCVFIARPHSRAGAADVRVPDLIALEKLVSNLLKHPG